MPFHPIFRRRSIEAARVQMKSLGHQPTPFYETATMPRRLLSHCQRCGARLTVDNNQRTMSGDAMRLPCDGNSQRAIESVAWLTGEIPVLLLRRLEEELRLLDDDVRARFDPGEFDYEGYCLWSEDGVYVIRWQQRDDPDFPIGPDNPQPRRGITFLEHVVADDEMIATRYIGPRLNPNGHEQEELWLVLPLESGERGVIYRDHNDRLRFRRHKGITGYYVRHEHLCVEKSQEKVNAGCKE